MNKTVYPRLFVLLVCATCNILSHHDNIYDDFLPQFQEEPCSLIRCLMNTPLFLRLERVGQCGVLKYGMTGGNVTRANHSRGVRSVAAIYVNALNSRLPDREKITSIQSLAIQVAGLLHDIGHGPFSHTFERMYRKIVPHWSHEDLSLRIVRHIFRTLDHPDKKKLPKDFVNAVCDMISGIGPAEHKERYKNSAHFNRYCLFTIVNNYLEISLTADTFDSMRRDTQRLCKPSYFRCATRCIAGIIRGSRIFNDRIVYSSRSSMELVNYSHVITMNYRYVYFDPELIGFDLLLCDIFRAMFDDQTLKSCVENLDNFVNFDDHFIERMITKGARDDNLQRRFVERNAYEFVHFWDTSPKSSVKSILEEIESRLKGTGIDSKDYIVHRLEISRVRWDPEDEPNILRKLKFYDEAPDLDHPINYLAKSCKNVKAVIPPRKSSNKSIELYYSMETPFNLRVIQFRLYAKTSSPEKLKELQKVAKSIKF